MAIATKSVYFKTSSNLCFNASLIPMHNLKATPAPHNPLNGYVQSCLLGFKIANAFGKVSFCL